jgi:predicted metal-dependent phosphoesterase TrpH
MEGKYIDLHVHSSESDGAFTVNEIVEMANNNQTKMLAISDHDTISAVPIFQKNICKGMMGVKAVEFSSYIEIDNKKRKIHLLCYCYDDDNEKLKNLLDEYRSKRYNAHAKLLYDLKKIINCIPEEEIAQLDMNRYCWFDREIVKCYEQAKYSQNIVEYLKDYYKKNRFSYGKNYEVDAQTIIDTIHSSGGYAIFAHPMAYNYDKEEVLKIINKLTLLGIDGLEVYQSDCLEEDSKWLIDLSNSRSLLTSVGSDFHRNYRSDGREIALGIEENLKIEETTLTNKILERKQFFKKEN